LQAKEEYKEDANPRVQSSGKRASTKDWGEPAEQPGQVAPFFHRIRVIAIRVIAAIFRAKVSRAIAGFMPFVSKPW